MLLTLLDQVLFSRMFSRVILSLALGIRLYRGRLFTNRVDYVRVGRYALM